MQSVASLVEQGYDMRIWSFHVIFTAAIAALSVFSGTAYSTTYVTVTPSEDLKAIVESAANDTVITLTAGTFNLTQQIDIANKANLTITGQSWDETTIKLTAANIPFCFYIGSNVSNLTIEKLRILGTYPPSVNNFAIANY